MCCTVIIFSVFFSKHGLIWTYTLIKFQTICLPTHLLSTTYFAFSLYFHVFLAIFHYNYFNVALFFIYLLLLVYSLKKLINLFKKLPTRFLDFCKIPTYKVIRFQNFFPPTRTPRLFGTLEYLIDFNFLENF